MKLRDGKYSMKNGQKDLRNGIHLPVGSIILIRSILQRTIIIFRDTI